MKYNIWVSPHMPLKEEREHDAVYIPRAYANDDRLSYLDSSVYIMLCMKEQLEAAEHDDITYLVESIKTHPDKSEEIFQKYLDDSGRTLETITIKEINNLDKPSVTINDIENSLARLIKFGYINEKS